MNYQDAQAKLLARVRDRIHSGELTERGLARQIGISQPHVHNVLKGVRNLSPEILDSILEHFQMSLLDLAEAGAARFGWHQDAAASCALAAAGYIEPVVSSDTGVVATAVRDVIHRIRARQFATPGMIEEKSISASELRMSSV